MQRFRGGLVFKAHSLCVSINSRFESNKAEKKHAVHRAARCLSMMGGYRGWRETALEATQGQMDDFFSQLTYKCHQHRMASVGDLLKIRPWVTSRVAACSGIITAGTCTACRVFLGAPLRCAPTASSPTSRPPPSPSCPPAGDTLLFSVVHLGGVVWDASHLLRGRNFIPSYHIPNPLSHPDGPWGAMNRGRERKVTRATAIQHGRDGRWAHTVQLEPTVARPG